jgi:hypothetical protein
LLHVTPPHFCHCFPSLSSLHFVPCFLP